MREQRGKLHLHGVELPLLGDYLVDVRCEERVSLDELGADGALDGGLDFGLGAGGQAGRGISRCSTHEEMVVSGGYGEYVLFLEHLECWLGNGEVGRKGDGYSRCRWESLKSQSKSNSIVLIAPQLARRGWRGFGHVMARARGRDIKRDDESRGR